jgi:hypothetical protein
LGIREVVIKWSWSRLGRIGVAALTVGATVSTTAGSVAGTARASRLHAKPAPAFTVLPVVSCHTEFGAGPIVDRFIPKTLPADGSLRGVSIYTNGLLTVMGPSGWACNGLVAGDGGENLVVVPPGSANSSGGDGGILPGHAAVEFDAEYTGHLPGAYFICPLFPGSAAASFANSSGIKCGTPATDQHIDRLTKDVVSFTDPAGVKGSGAGSGGKLTSVGVAIYPQTLPAPQSVNVFQLSCTVPKKLASHCSAIVADFMVRNAPVYAGTESPL